MRALIAGLIGVWAILTAFAYTVVLPDERGDEALALAYLDLGPAEGPAGTIVADYLAHYRSQNPQEHPTPEQFRTLPDAERSAFAALFRDWYDRTQPKPLADAPTLVWSTDDNPARRVQCHLFRVWHLRTFGEPLDIATDPSNRDTTKTVVQCVAGAGPDLIESYGPSQLAQFVDAGVALDVTDLALQRGFGPETVFSAALTSMSRDGRQYAFPCNVGYTILFYHRDLFAQAGIPEPPPQGWTIEQMLGAARKLTALEASGGRRRVGIMGMSAWAMALADGGVFFNDKATASIFNSPETVAAFRTFQELMYLHQVMPTPAELASMAASGGANMNMGAEAASASALFSAKICAMVVDGRWSYVTFARRQLDRVIFPALQRRIAALESDSAREEARLLKDAVASLTRDVLVPISDRQHELIEAALTPQDRAELLNLGVAHIPTTTGTPFYEAAARVAIVNRASPRAPLAARFLEFLASEEYNNQINFTFDSISGTPGIIARNGISGPPRALPGLEAFDSPIFVDAMDSYAHPKQLSPFVGDARVGQLAGPVIEQLTNNLIGPAEAARLIENRINAQIRANLLRDAALRALWESLEGKPFDPDVPLRDQASSAPPQAPPARPAPRAHQPRHHAAPALPAPGAHLRPLPLAAVNA